MKKLAILAVALVLGVSTPRPARAVDEAALWLVSQMTCTTDSIFVPLYVMFQWPLNSIRAPVEYDSTHYIFQRFKWGPSIEAPDFAIANDTPPTAEHPIYCANSGNRIVVLLFLWYLGYPEPALEWDIGRKVGDLVFTVRDDEPHASAMKLTCNYETTVEIGSIPSHYAWGDSLAVGNACVRVQGNPCQGPPNCPTGDWTSQDCPRCPPQLSPPERARVGVEPRAWGVVKELYR